MNRVGFHARFVVLVSSLLLIAACGESRLEFEVPTPAFPADL